MWIEALVIPLILAAISALIYIAYKHAKGYKRIAVEIGIVACLFFLIVTAYSLGYIHSNIRMLQSKLKESPETEISRISFNITRLNDNWTLLNWAFVIFVIVAGYLVFLYFLHDILGDGGQPAKKEKKRIKSSK